MCSCQWCVICARIPGGDSRVRVARSCIGPNPQARMVPGSGFHQCGVDRLRRGEVQWVDGEAKRRDIGVVQYHWLCVCHLRGCGHLEGRAS